MTTTPRITYVVYGTRITGDHRRWCAVCGTQRATERVGGIAQFVTHNKPNGQPCPNSGQRVNKQEQAG